MKQYSVTIGKHDSDLLDSELRAALGDRIAGFSFYHPDRPIDVHFVDEPGAEDVATVERIVKAHDPAKAKPKPQPVTIESLLKRIEDLEAKAKKS